MHGPAMLRGNASWVAGLFCVCIVILGCVGQPVDNKEDTSVIHQTEETSREKATPAPVKNMEEESTFATKHDVWPSLSAEEQDFVLKRKQVVWKSLNKLGIKCALDSVPHVALLGSGGGQRAAVGLVGSLYQMEKEGLLDTLLYLGGVSGSAWSMSSLYSDPQWSNNMDKAVSRLSGPGVELDEALAWLSERAKEEHFSLTDIWGLMTSAGIMKQLDTRHLSEDGNDAFNPFPIYNAVNKNCLHQGPETGKWFEMTPYEAGFTDLGLFINTSHLGSRLHDAYPEVKEMDMVQVQGIVGSAVADEQSVINYILDWQKAPQEVKTLWDVLNHYIHGYHSLLKLKQLVKNNTEKPQDSAVLSALDNLQKILTGMKKTQIPEQWRQKILAPLQTWSQSLDEGPVKQYVSWLVQKVFPLILKWEWGTTVNFLYQYPGAVVPACIRLQEHLQLIDAGVMLSTPYPPFLGERRDADLLIALEYGDEDTFRTLILARDYAAKVKKLFPDIDNKVLEERDWPKDCYVFEGKEKEPTIVYMPLFNRQNCKDAKELKAKMEEFSTFQHPFSQEKIDFVLETAKTNVKNNKETLLREIKKAVLRRQRM